MRWRRHRGRSGRSTTTSNELDRIAVPDSVTADDLKRQMRDARGLLSLARIELRMPAFVPRWYRKTIDTVRDYPRILRATATAVRMGVDVARPMVDAWHRFEHGFSQLVLDSVENAATELLAVSQRWEVERAGRRDAPVAAAGSPPPDFDLAEARRRILGGDAPPKTWWPFITNLDLSNTLFSHLELLSGLTSLQTLDLRGAQEWDLSPLAGLTALRTLDLRGTSVSDVSPLSGLTALQTLHLGTQVSNALPFRLSRPAKS